VQHAQCSSQHAEKAGADKGVRATRKDGADTRTQTHGHYSHQDTKTPTHSLGPQSNMAGGQPFPIQSPTQTSHFLPYSPTSKPHNSYNYEQYQHPAQTPPSFPPATLARSPHFAHTVAATSPPPARNGTSHPPDTPSQYHLNSTPPHQQSLHAYSGPMTTPNGHLPHGHLPTPHANPLTRPDSLPLSPQPEYNNPGLDNPKLNMSSPGDAPSAAYISKPSAPEVTNL
jgi:chromatin-remodeling ATPase INO80